MRERLDCAQDYFDVADIEDKDGLSTAFYPLWLGDSFFFGTRYSADSITPKFHSEAWTSEDVNKLNS